MVESYLLAALIVGIFFISISIIQLKRQKIRQGTFVVWSLIGIAGISIALVPSSVSFFQSVLGTQFTVSALLGIATLSLFIIVFYLHQRADSLNQRMTKLITELALNRFYKNANSTDEKNDDFSKKS